MTTLAVRLLDVHRQRLDDVVDVVVSRVRDGAVIASVRGIHASRSVTVTKLDPGTACAIAVYPLRHRPVCLVTMLGTSKTVVELICPLHPLRAQARFPGYDELPAPLVAVLEQSALETGPRGRALWGALDDLARAGLLNLYAKLSATLLGDAPIWLHVRRVYRVRGDRIFAEVACDLRDQVKSWASVFTAVSGRLHAPPPGFAPAGSFKHTAFPSGILQLTFFVSVTAPLTFLVDADIDEADGLGHVFQVLRNWLITGQTHPYDIHQLLITQSIDPGYTVVAA